MKILILSSRAFFFFLMLSAIFAALNIITNTQYSTIFETFLNRTINASVNLFSSGWPRLNKNISTETTEKAQLVPFLSTFNIKSLTGNTSSLNNTVFAYKSFTTGVTGKPFKEIKSYVEMINMVRNRATSLKLTWNDTTDGRAAICGSFAFVTGADSHHFAESQTLVASIQRYFPDTPVIYYNLGLRREYVTEVKSWCGVKYKRFPFNIYPPHVQNLQTYAFKPIAIMESLLDYAGVFWLDASIQICTSNLRPVWDIAINNGDLSGVFPAIRPHDTTHSDMYNYLSTDIGNYREAKMAAAGAMFIYNTIDVFDEILQWHFACALEPQCIRPDGATTNCGSIHREHKPKDSKSRDTQEPVIESLTPSRELITNKSNEINPQIRSNSSVIVARETLWTVDELEPSIPVTRCHRFDQSSLNILTYNYERKRSKTSTISPVYPDEWDFGQSGTVMKLHEKPAKPLELKIC